MDLFQLIDFLSMFLRVVRVLQCNLVQNSEWKSQSEEIYLHSAIFIFCLSCFVLEVIERVCEIEIKTWKLLNEITMQRNENLVLMWSTWSKWITFIKRVLFPLGSWHTTFERGSENVLFVRLLSFRLLTDLRNTWKFGRDIFVEHSCDQQCHAHVTLVFP